MARHIVARTTRSRPAANKVVAVDAATSSCSMSTASSSRCSTVPHEAHRSTGACVARLTSSEPGVYQVSRVGELLRCAGMLGIRHAQRPILFRSGPRQDPDYPVVIEDGETLAKGPYVAETFRCTSRTATSLWKLDQLKAQAF